MTSEGPRGLVGAAKGAVGAVEGAVRGALSGALEGGERSSVCVFDVRACVRAGGARGGAA